MNASSQHIDEFIKKIIKECLSFQKDWLDATFRKCEYISRERKATADYGFEWSIQTAFSQFLLLKQDDLRISEITVAQEYLNKKRYDITFKVSNELVLLELKTSSMADTCGVKKDMAKEFPTFAKLKYFLLFCYPFDEKSKPEISGSELIDSGKTHRDFRYYLFKN